MRKSEHVVTLPEFAEIEAICDLARRNLLPMNVIKLGRRPCLSRKEVESLLGATAKTQEPMEAIETTFEINQKSNKQLKTGGTNQ